MTIIMRDASNTPRSVARASVRDVTNTLRTASRIMMRDATNTLRTAFSSMAVAASPSDVTGFAYQAGAASITTNTTTANVSGGASPFIYAWAQVSGDTIGITNPTGASTAFTASGVAGGQSRSGVFQCTVTGADGVVAIAGVSVYMENYGGFA